MQRHTSGAVESLVQYYYKCSPDAESEIRLKFGQYLIKLKRMKVRRTKSVPVFLDHPVVCHYCICVKPCNCDIAALLDVEYRGKFRNMRKREREIFIRKKQASRRDMPIKPGAYCLATYQ